MDNIDEEYVCGPQACSKCLDYCGTLFLIDEGPQPPLHDNCLCERVRVKIDREEYRRSGRLVKQE